MSHDMYQHQFNFGHGHSSSSAYMVDYNQSPHGAASQQQQAFYPTMEPVYPPMMPGPYTNQYGYVDPSPYMHGYTHDQQWMMAQQQQVACPVPTVPFYDMAPMHTMQNPCHYNQTLQSSNFVQHQTWVQHQQPTSSAETSYQAAVLEPTTQNTVPSSSSTTPNTVSQSPSPRLQMGYTLPETPFDPSTVVYTTKSSRAGAAASASATARKKCRSVKRTYSGEVRKAEVECKFKTGQVILTCRDGELIRTRGARNPDFQLLYNRKFQLCPGHKFDADHLFYVVQHLAIHDTALRRFACSQCNYSSVRMDKVREHISSKCAGGQCIYKNDAHFVSQLKSWSETCFPDHVTRIFEFHEQSVNASTVRAKKAKGDQTPRIKCAKCGKEVNDTPASRSYHSKTHSKTFRYRCGVCGKRGHLKDNLVQHIVKHHSGLGIVEDLLNTDSVHEYGVLRIECFPSRKHQIQDQEEATVEEEEACSQYNDFEHLITEPGAKRMIMSPETITTHNFAPSLTPIEPIVETRSGEDLQQTTQTQDDLRREFEEWFDVPDAPTQVEEKSSESAILDDQDEEMRKCLNKFAEDFVSSPSEWSIPSLSETFELY